MNSTRSVLEEAAGAFEVTKVQRFPQTLCSSAEGTGPFAHLWHQNCSIIALLESPCVSSPAARSWTVPRPLQREGARDPSFGDRPAEPAVGMWMSCRGASPHGTDAEINPLGGVSSGGSSPRQDGCEPVCVGAGPAPGLCHLLWDTGRKVPASRQDAQALPRAEDRGQAAPRPRAPVMERARWQPQSSSEPLMGLKRDQQPAPGLEVGWELILAAVGCCCPNSDGRNPFSSFSSFFSHMKHNHQPEKKQITQKSVQNLDPFCCCLKRGAWSKS